MAAFCSRCVLSPLHGAKSVVLGVLGVYGKKCLRISPARLVVVNCCSPVLENQVIQTVAQPQNERQGQGSDLLFLGRQISQSKL